MADDPAGTGSWSTEAECNARAQALMERDYSIHLHVWDRYAMLELLLRMRDRFGLALAPEAMLSTGEEVILVLRKGPNSAVA